MRLSKRIFFLVVFLIPVNLGKHFILRDSYVYGLLVDYLIPTIYMQDILLILFSVIWLINIILNARIRQKVVDALKYHAFFQVLILFLFSLVLSTLSSSNLIISGTYFIRTLLYSITALYIFVEFDKKDITKMIDVLALSLLFLGIMGIGQFVSRGSLFDNYLILGEQPYDLSTKNLNFEYLLGRKVIPPYGLFRHPNVFAGYLVLVLSFLLMLILPEISLYKAKKRLGFTYSALNPFKNPYMYFTLLIGLVTLLISYSYISYITFSLALLLVLLKVYKKKSITLLLSFLLIIFVNISPLASRIYPLNRHASFYRRDGLLNSSLYQFTNNPLFGVGYGMSTETIESVSEMFFSTRFVQPVHNIYALVLSEAGIFAGVLFVCLIFISFIKANGSIFIVVLLPLIILGSFDHYFFTSHQMHLFMWIILGLSLLDTRVYEYN